MLKVTEGLAGCGQGPWRKPVTCPLVEGSEARAEPGGPARLTRLGVRSGAQAAAGRASGQVQVERRRGGEEEAVNAEAVPQVPRDGGEGGTTGQPGRLQNHTPFPSLPICSTDSLMSNRR